MLLEHRIRRDVEAYGLTLRFCSEPQPVEPYVQVRGTAQKIALLDVRITVEDADGTEHALRARVTEECDIITRIQWRPRLSTVGVFRPPLIATKQKKHNRAVRLKQKPENP